VKLVWIVLAQLALVFVLGVVRVATGPSWLDVAGPIAVSLLALSSIVLILASTNRFLRSLPKRHRIAREWARSEH
jgi:hypothetical protein